jgi:hypothetical protein
MRYLGDGEAHGNGFVSFACGADSIVLPRKNVLRTRQWTNGECLSESRRNRGEEPDNKYE